MKRSNSLQSPDNFRRRASRPLASFAKLIRRKSEIAGALEDIADRLPKVADRARCATLSKQIPPLLDICDTIDREVIFPILIKHPASMLFTPSTVERLVAERSMDQGYALEVSELLARLAEAQAIDNIDAAAYMLRGFFEITRRSAAFDLEFVVPMARRCLAQADLDRMHGLLHRQQIDLRGPGAQVIRSRKLQ